MFAGIPVQAVVDTVLTGSTVKIVTLPERAVLTLALTGAQSPNVRRMPDGTLEGDPFGREACSLFHAHQSTRFPLSLQSTRARAIRVPETACRHSSNDSAGTVVLVGPEPVFTTT